MPLVQANGVRLNLQEMGSDGPPVVMVHGLMMGTISTWYFGVAPALADSHRVYLYDLRNHGLSERAESGFTLDEMAEDLGAVIAHSGNQPVMLVGHSYGGAIALRYASRHPELVRRLVLVEAPVPRVQADLDVLRWAYRMRRRAANNRGEDLVQALSEADKEALFGDLPAFIRDALLRNGKRPNRLLAQILGLIANTTMVTDLHDEPPFTAAEIETVQCPVLLCYGKRSVMRPPPDHVLLTALPDATLRLLPGGHSLPQEATTELIDTIKEFLRD